MHINEYILKYIISRRKSGELFRSGGLTQRDFSEVSTCYFRISCIAAKPKRFVFIIMETKNDSSKHFMSHTNRSLF